MKHSIIALGIVFFLATQLFAQPQVMNYQGVARDNAGIVIANQEISLRISILAENITGTPVFAETHKIKTSQFGVFSLKIGTGEPLISDISQINWANSDHYIQVEMDATGGENYQLMGASQLLSVPYAFHALTAGKIMNNNELNLKKGIPSQTWSLFGNAKTDPTKDKMGTTDNTDLIFITDDKERLRITADGKLITPDGVGLDLGGNLKVRGDSTSIDKDLFVGRNVHLNFSDDFSPRGETYNYGKFTVENQSATLLTGELQVDKNALFKEQVTIDDPGIGSTSATTGGLVVAGGTGIGENLFVGGATQLEGATEIKNTLNVDGATDLESTLNVNGNSTVKKLSANGQVTVNASLGSSEDNYNNYPLQVEGSDNGIAIKLTPNTPLRGNNFISFWGGDNTAKGRIEGSNGAGEFFRSAVIGMIGGNPDIEDAFDRSTSKNKQSEGKTVSTGDYFNNDYAYGGLSITFDFVNSIIKFGINLYAAGGLACTLADCDDVVWGAVDMVVNGLQLGGYIAYNEVNKGVAFESGGADYAEWLMKNDTNEVFTFGDVVCVHGGLISKDFKIVDKYMVVSKDPTVIGAMPDKKNEKNYERIAFMGQVSVKVIGKVKKGDYILPSGNNDGMAIAVSPNLMAPLDYSRIIGIAWGESDGKNLFNYINTAVGINSNDMAGIIDQMQSVINDMQLALNTVVPDFQPQLYATSGNSNIPANQYTKSQSLQDIIGNNSDALQYKSLDEALLKAKQYAEIQNFDFSQYPYLEEILENPNPELAKEMVDHYSTVLNNIATLMAEVQKN
jgi:hypothetical protein